VTWKTTARERRDEFERLGISDHIHDHPVSTGQRPRRNGAARARENDYVPKLNLPTDTELVETICARVDVLNDSP
jgi:hypothetical protein